MNVGLADGVGVGVEDIGVATVVGVGFTTGLDDFVPDGREGLAVAVVSW